MQTLILSLHVIVCVALVVLVLLQSGKEGMGVIFGGGNASVFGSSGAGGLLAKLTAFMAVLFVITWPRLQPAFQHNQGTGIDDSGHPAGRRAETRCRSRGRTGQATRSRRTGQRTSQSAGSRRAGRFGKLTPFSQCTNRPGTSEFPACFIFSCPHLAGAHNPSPFSLHDAAFSRKNRSMRHGKCRCTTEQLVQAQKIQRDGTGTGGKAYPGAAALPL